MKIQTYSSVGDFVDQNRIEVLVRTFATKKEDTPKRVEFVYERKVLGTLLLLLIQDATDYIIDFR